MTSRDYQIRQFIRDYKIVRTDTIAAMFFPSANSCCKRLKILYEKKLFDRIKDTDTGDYLYFINRPKLLKHSLMVTDFYGKAARNVHIEFFKLEPVYDFIRPDALMGYTVKGKKYIAFVEIELSNKGFDVYKYEKLYNSGDYKKFFPVMPIIIAVTDRKIMPTNLKLIKISENLSDIANIVK